MPRNLRRDSQIPPYMAYPRFLLTMDISETAKLVYVLLLDRARLSMKNEGWEDENGYAYIDSRYRSQKPMIVTTNLKLKELKDPEDLARARIYDRVLERCVPILVNDQNVRKLIAA